VQTLEVTRIQSPKQELMAPNFEDLANEFYDDESSVRWYVMVRAVEQFRDKNFGCYPGTTQGDDTQALRSEVDSVMSQIFPMDDGSMKIEDKYIQEMIRFGDSKLHNVSAFLGGVASQEAIKVLIS
jgi:NEDD8-activating enzyme E1 regulatory subunit